MSTKNKSFEAYDEKSLLAYINSKAVLLSLLYDLDLLPEQIDHSSIKWAEMLTIAAHFKSHEEAILSIQQKEQSA